MKLVYHSCLTFILVCGTFLSSSSIFAQPALGATQHTASSAAFDDPFNRTPPFDSLMANKALQTLKADLSSGQNNVREIQAAMTALNAFQLQAKKCVDTNNTQLDKLNQRLAEISALNALPQTKEAVLTEEQKYLNNKKQQLNNQLSECRLFSLRSEEVTTQLAQRLREMVTTRLFYAHANVFENLHNFPSQLSKYVQTFDSQRFLKDSGLVFFSGSHSLLLLLPALLILLITYGRRHLRERFRKGYAGSSLIKQPQLINTCTQYLPILLGIIILAAFLSIFTHSLITPSYLALISYASIAYVLFLAVVNFLLSSPAVVFTRLPEPAARKLTKHFHKFATLCFITYSIYMCLHEQTTEHALQDVFRTLVITLLSTYLIAIIWTIKKLPKGEGQAGALKLVLSVFLVCLLTFVLITEYLGYHLLAIYLLYGIVMTSVITCAARLLDRAIGSGLDILKGTARPWQQRLRSHFGLKRNERLIEILWLRALLYIMLWLAFLVALLKIWGLAEANFQVVVNGLLYGLDIGKLHIVPSRILGGALLFIVLALITRWLRAYIVKNSHWQLETGSRESLASIVGYLGFALAFIFGALIAGVNFSGLALIAGALSVGIGFGLQNIVNNFVSGIILLIERPVKLGDRIIVGHTEGYVKKISIRSTHLITTQCTDVIVPNSELIAQQVTNYMLHDMNYKVSTAVGIAYGSNTDLAKSILLGVAKNHPQVIINRKDLEPAVYFRSFGESSLNFELYCVIKDINMKFQVISDLNFAIEKAFKEKGVEIAFPQREIRITQWQQRPPPELSD